MSFHLPFFIFREVYKKFLPLNKTQDIISRIMADCDPSNYTENLPNFSDIIWKSDASFKFSTFENFHASANSCLAWIFPNYTEGFDGYNIDPEHPLDFSEDRVNIDDIIWGNRGPLAFAIIGLIFAAVLTIFGIGWCCMKFCCCCCGSKGKSKPSDRYNSGYDGDHLLGRYRGEDKREKRIRICCGVTLMIWIILSFFSLISLFVMNNQLRDGINGVKEDIDNSLNDVELYLDTTSQQIDGIFVTSYTNLSVSLNCVLDDAFNTSVRKVDTDASSSIGKITFQQFDFLYEQEQQRQSTIVNSIDSTINNLAEFCQNHICGDRAELSKNLTNIASTISNIKSLTAYIQEYSLNVQSTIQTLQTSKESSITADKEQIQELIRTQGQNLNENSKALTGALDDVAAEVRTARHDLEEVEIEFDKVNPHLHSSILVICLFLLMVSLLLFFGGILSFFGNSNKAAKRTRAITLNCGIFTIFLFGGILWIFTMACFLLGGVLTQVLPGAFKYIENNSTNISQVIGLPQSIINAEYKFPGYGSVVRDCKDGHSAYITLDLHQVYDVETIKNLVDEFREQINSTAVILNNKRMESLTRSSSKIQNLTNQLESAQTRITPLLNDLEYILESVRNLAQTNANASLQSSIDILEEIYVNELPNVKTGLGKINNSLSTISNEISRIQAENNNNRDTEWMEQFLSYIANYSEFVYDEITENAGQCEPMYNALQATINIFSYKIGSPIAGFWFSLNVVMLLFFPSIITAIVLTRL